MDKLADPSFALVGAHLAVEVLVGHDVGGQLAPGGRDFAIVLLEQHLAALALDGGRPQAPFHRGEGVGVVVGAKHWRDFHVLAVLLSGSRMGPLGRHDRILGVAFQLVHSYSSLSPLGFCVSLPTTIYCTHIHVGYNIQRRMSKFNDFLALVKQAGKMRLKRLKTEGLRIVPPVVVGNDRSLTIVGQTPVFPGSWRFPGNGCVRSSPKWIWRWPGGLSANHSRVRETLRPYSQAELQTARCATSGPKSLGLEARCFTQ